MQHSRRIRGTGFELTTRFVITKFVPNETSYVMSVLRSSSCLTYSIQCCDERKEEEKKPRLRLIAR